MVAYRPEFLPSFVTQQTPPGWGKVMRHARMGGTVIEIDPTRYAQHLKADGRYLRRHWRRERRRLDMSHRAMRKAKALMGDRWPAGGNLKGARRG